jgi:hypothetical protein
LLRVALKTGNGSSFSLFAVANPSKAWLRAEFVSLGLERVAFLVLVLYWVEGLVGCGVLLFATEVWPLVMMPIPTCTIQEK